MIKNIMKNNSTFWGIMAATAIMFSAGAGYAGSKNIQTATHYNSTPLDAPDQTPNWEPIVPGGDGSLSCESNPNRDCKAMQDSQGNFIVLETGNYPGL
ncbi:hypothetical protein FXV77_10540 [Sphingobacterium phlebotomi]|uniref:Uncharacterized protein n=1 Tax=Sphingobacterium phlebotomi TaxID=2605433 RepID=A0A5D4H6V6_9SPHI|nr:hypothetical protein [Sphingobacterium phlebotomi]TYR36337.1 hypothetical protein FXV77_10540 [Sphingobacterium phlebotomi]